MQSDFEKIGDILVRNCVFITSAQVTGGGIIKEFSTKHKSKQHPNCWTVSDTE